MTYRWLSDVPSPTSTSPGSRSRNARWPARTPRLLGRELGAEARAPQCFQECLIGHDDFPRSWSRRAIAGLTRPGQHVCSARRAKASTSVFAMPSNTPPASLPTSAAVEFVAKQEFDLARVRPRARRTATRPRSAGTAPRRGGSPSSAGALRIAGGEVEAQAVIVDGEPRRDHGCRPARGSRAGAPRQERRVVLGRFDQVEGARRRAGR